jgi:hypothetical protein
VAPKRRNIFNGLNVLVSLKMYLFLTNAASSIQAVSDVSVSNESHSYRQCGLVVRVSGYRLKGRGFGFRRYQIF